MKILIDKKETVVTQKKEIDIPTPSFYNGGYYHYKITEDAVTQASDNLILVNTVDMVGPFNERVSEAIAYPVCSEQEFDEKFNRVLNKLPLPASHERYFYSVVMQCIDVLRDHIEPGGKMTDGDFIGKLYGILDNKIIAEKIKGVPEYNIDNIMKVLDVYQTELLPETFDYIMAGTKATWKDTTDCHEHIYNIENILDAIKEMEEDIHNPIEEDQKIYIDDILKLSGRLEYHDAQYFRLILEPIKK